MKEVTEQISDESKKISSVVDYLFSVIKSLQAVYEGKTISESQKVKIFPVLLQKYFGIPGLKHRKDHALDKDRYNRSIEHNKNSAGVELDSNGEPIIEGYSRNEILESCQLVINQLAKSSIRQLLSIYFQNYFGLLRNKPSLIQKKQFNQVLDLFKKKTMNELSQHWLIFSISEKNEEIRGVIKATNAMLSGFEITEPVISFNDDKGLKNLDLSHLDLANVNFRGKSVAGVNFDGCKIEPAKLFFAKDLHQVVNISQELLKKIIKNRYDKFRNNIQIKLESLSKAKESVRDLLLFKKLLNKGDLSVVNTDSPNGNEITFKTAFFILTYLGFAEPNNEPFTLENVIQNGMDWLKKQPSQKVTSAVNFLKNSMDIDSAFVNEAISSKFRTLFKDPVEDLSNSISDYNAQAKSELDFAEYQKFKTFLDTTKEKLRQYLQENKVLDVKFKKQLIDIHIKTMTIDGIQYAMLHAEELNIPLDFSQLNLEPLKQQFSKLDLSLVPVKFTLQQKRNYFTKKQLSDHYSPLIKALMSSNPKQVDMMLNLLGIGINEFNHLASTPLMTACRMNSYSMVSYLVEKKSASLHGLKNQDNKKVYILEYAIKLHGPNHRIVSYLCEKGAELTPSTAMLLHKFDKVKELLSEDNVNTRDGLTGLYPLQLATKLGLIDLVKHLCDTLHAELMVKDKMGRNILHYSCYSDNVKLFNYLKEKTHFDCSQAIFDFTAQQKSMSLLRVLKAKYPDHLTIDAIIALENPSLLKTRIKKSSNTRTFAIKRAAHMGSVFMLSQLIKLGAQPKKVYNKKDTLAHIAARQNNHGVIRELANNGVSLTQINEAGESPLFILASLGFVETFQALVEQFKININAIPGSEPLLHVAVRLKNCELVKYLLDKNIHRDTQHNGVTALHLAAQQEQTNITKLLISGASPADPTIPDSQGRLPIHYAIRDKRVKQFKILAKNLPPTKAIANNKVKSILLYANSTGRKDMAREIKLFQSRALQTEDKIEKIKEKTKSDIDSAPKITK